MEMKEFYFALFVTIHTFIRHSSFCSSNLSVFCRFGDIGAATLLFLKVHWLKSHIIWILWWRKRNFRSCIVEVVKLFRLDILMLDYNIHFPHKSDDYRFNELLLHHQGISPISQANITIMLLRSTRLWLPLGMKSRCTVVDCEHSYSIFSPYLNSDVQKRSIAVSTS